MALVSDLQVANAALAGCTTKPLTGSVALTADLLSETENPRCVAGCGIDTIAYAFRPRWAEFLDRLLMQPHNLQGETAIFRTPLPGVNVIALSRFGLVKVEGRLDPLLEGHPDTWELRSPTEVPRGERAALRLVELVADAPMAGERGLDTAAEVARFDLTAELDFSDRPADGLAFLRAAASLLPARRKTDAVRGNDGQVQTIYLRTPKAFAVRERIYDKAEEIRAHRGRKACSEPAGSRIRIESQHRPAKKDRMTPERFVGADHAALFGRAVEPYTRQESVAVGTDQAAAELLRRVDKGDLSMSKARGLLGDLVILAQFGRAAYADSTGYRRLAALREAGVALESILPPDRLLPVGRLLADAIAAWSAEGPSPAPRSGSPEWTTPEPASAGSGASAGAQAPAREGLR